MKKIKAVTLVLSLVTSLVLSACGGSAGTSTSEAKPDSQPASTEKSAQPSGDTIKVGMVVEMTGLAALSGKLKEQGAKLAVEQINANGGVLGKKIELLMEDDQTTNPGAVSAYQKLMKEDVVAVVGSIRSTATQALDPYVRKDGIPMLFGGTNDKLTDMGNEWLFRFRPADRYATKVMVDFMVNDLKKEKAAIVYSAESFGENGKDLIEKELEALGLKPAAILNFTPGNKDWTPDSSEYQPIGR